MGISDSEGWRAAHRVRRRATRVRCNAVAHACALASGGVLLGACIEQKALFAEYEVMRITHGADAGGESSADVLMPSAPEAPNEAPPVGAELTGMAGARATSEPSAAPPPEIGESSDAGTIAPDDAPLTNEACSVCLSNECPDAIQTCRATPGCEAISTCAQNTGCVEDECYCGSVERVLCVTTGEGNGPCRDVTLAAPGAHEPTPAVPNAGVAAEAARSLGSCRRASADCRDACGG